MMVVKHTVGPLLVVILSATGILIDSMISQTQAQGPPRSPKVHPAISRVVERIEQAGITPDTVDLHELGRFSTPLVKVDGRGRLQVYVQVAQLDDATLNTLRAAGLAVDRADARHGIVQGWVPFHRLDELASLAGVKRIRAPDYVVPHGRGGRRPASDPGITPP